ncbi:ABC transporter substrate-binding protein [Pseudomonas oryzihabitans]|uniref:Spermidine/putrescine transport system substrate-binding protein n=1 Tax=Pseudomonas oryzihabitans TaxID=47885 RepID=A0AAJ2C1Q9_9PSED|nr:ABC transporter substrate-binding protein [Pseudomonas psychrotolerans]MDR6236483.1 putative spermidine/putrescine transport system substrate-binding protein [Pseudomonas psychrotolerans]MDR6676148.1 putative spermidine/putrescine transport system substrate-binding protein [Pseudomonas psychrotolerans]QDD88595.1 ABC transporter substrate-binding protein [Pseudomonas psychrotolerans]
MKRINWSNVTLAIAVGVVTVQSEAAESITFAGWGGALQDAERKAYLEPAAKHLGVTIKEDTMDGLAAVRAQVMSGKPEWDVVELASNDCVLAEAQGLTEPLDYSIIKVDGVDPKLRGKNWIASNAYSTVLAWTTEKDAAKVRTWKEFFDPAVKGPRALYRQPFTTLELALMADGVAPKDLYPLDVDRAFKVLERIKPQVVNWWSSGSDSAQLLRSREVDFLSIWASRVDDLKKSGAPVDYTYDQALVDYDCVVVPKGARNKAGAMQLIAQIMSPESQAKLVTLIPNPPINTKAYDTGIIPAELAATLPTAPANAAKTALFDPRWWQDHQAELQRRFDLFIQN